MADLPENERRILVAVDEGEESMYALSWCLKNLVFENSKDTLILLYVKPPRAVYSAFDGTGRYNITNPHTSTIIIIIMSAKLFSFLVVHASGYLFSSDITATMDRYSQQVADCILEKAKRLCNNLQNVRT